MNSSVLCQNEQRRHDVRQHTDAHGQPDLNGIDYIEISDDQRVLMVYFLGKAPELGIAQVRIDGGRRITGIQVTDLQFCLADDPERDDCVQVTVNRPGDFSTYTLRLVEPDEHGRPGDRPLAGFDRRYAQIAFSFKVNCPSQLDCKADPVCPEEPAPQPEISYLAKDYASFRQLMLDRLALTMPAWTERHIPDIGIALVELLAYVGDHLSYYQDAVATEAYLDTARQRISVRRHMRLVDYRMHEGCNARTWVHLKTVNDLQLNPQKVYFTTRFSATPVEGDRVHAESELVDVPPDRYEVFEPLDCATTIDIRRSHNEIAIYTWGDTECCLPRGTTSITLRDEWADALSDDQEQAEKVEQEQVAPKSRKRPRPAPEPEPPGRTLQLNPGDLLLLEEVLGPHTGNPADADPKHRHVVRLTSVEPGVDMLYEDEQGRPLPIVEVSWAAEDALPFALCVSAMTEAPQCRYLEDVSVARGNILLADHGRRVHENLDPVPDLAAEYTGCLGPGQPSDPVYRSAPFRPHLTHTPLTHRAPFPAPAAIARQQAQHLCGVMAQVRARVRVLLQQTQTGEVLADNQIDELQRIYGQRALAESGLPKPAPRTRRKPDSEAQAKALAWLLAYEDRLLGPKIHHVTTLAERAEAGYLLSTDSVNEIVEMFGGRYAEGLAPTIARQQAQHLRGVVAQVRARVRALLQQTRAGEVLADTQIDELQRIYGQRALAESGLPKPAPRTRRKPDSEAQAKALTSLLADEDRLLGQKIRRVTTLAERAEAGYLLSTDSVNEIVEMFGAHYAEGLAGDNPAVFGPASGALRQNVREALPVLHLHEQRQITPGIAKLIGASPWQPQYDLLASPPDAREFVTEIDNSGTVRLRFGNGSMGREPLPGMVFRAEYRVGNGSAGNIGAEALTHLVFRDAVPSGAIEHVRNPLPAQGGTDPEPIAEARLFAPTQFRAEMRRAITADDYARLAERHPDVQRAAAQLRWTGSWYAVHVAIDAYGGTADPLLLDQVRRSLHRYRRIGHDLVVQTAQFVSLEISLTVCVKPGYQRGHVRAALLDRLSTRTLPDGSRGFFHPDNLTFGSGIRLSKLIAAVHAISGVETVEITTFKRLYEPPQGELEAGILKLGPFEVARLDNNPNMPEHGRLELILRGGR